MRYRSPAMGALETNLSGITNIKEKRGRGKREEKKMGSKRLKTGRKRESYLHL